jgi:hypothetical protein
MFEQSATSVQVAMVTGPILCLQIAHSTRRCACYTEVCRSKTVLSILTFVLPSCASVSSCMLLFARQCHELGVGVQKPVMLNTSECCCYGDQGTVNTHTTEP